MSGDPLNNKDGAGGNMSGDEAGADEEIDEEEVIDVAERIFIRIAEAMITQERASVRDVFRENIEVREIEGTLLELLQPIGLIEGIKDLGIDDLSEKEIHFMLRVLTKPELEGAIVVDELLKIMENLGLYEDDDDAMDPEMGDMDDLDDMQQQPRDEEAQDGDQ